MESLLPEDDDGSGGIPRDVLLSSAVCGPLRCASRRLPLLGGLFPRPGRQGSLMLLLPLLLLLLYFAAVVNTVVERRLTYFLLILYPFRKFSTPQNTSNFRGREFTKGVEN